MHDNHPTGTAVRRADAGEGARMLGPPILAPAVPRGFGAGQGHELHSGVAPSADCTGLTGMARQMCHAFF